MECLWLDTDIPVGTTIWFYEGATYDCISGNGVVVTAKAAEHHSLNYQLTRSDGRFNE